MEIRQGTRVIAFDGSLFKDDVSTPLSFTLRRGTVTCRYGKRSSGRVYPDLVDIKFDHRPSISHGHFTDGLTYIITE